MDDELELSLPQVTKEDIVVGLHALGIEPGRGVMVHSSLKSFGRVVGGPQAVIEALFEVITPEGTLLMPSFNQGRPFRKGGEDCFDVRRTPTVNGSIPDLFWRMPGVYRSFNPTHAFAAWGKNAERYTKYHHRTLTLGSESPLGLLYKDDGYGLLIGVDYKVNTFHHTVEVMLGAPCLGLRTESHPVILPDGRRVEGRTWSYRTKSCQFTDWGMYGEDMEARGLHKTVYVGNSRLTLFKMKDCFQVIAELLKQGRNGLPPCSRCSTKPYFYQEGIVSDWDNENQCLKPDSKAWDY